MSWDETIHALSATGVAAKRVADLNLDIVELAKLARDALIAAGKDARGGGFVTGGRTYVVDRQPVGSSVWLLDTSGGRRRLFDLTPRPQSWR